MTIEDKRKKWRDARLCWRVVSIALWTTFGLFALVAICVEPIGPRGRQGTILIVSKRHKPAQIADFHFGAVAQPGQTFTNGTVDLPAVPSDAGGVAELEGAICNGFTAASREICGVSIWVEDGMGNVLTGPTGLPVPEIRSGSFRTARSAGRARMDATQLGYYRGVATFGLAYAIPASAACGEFELQLGAIEAPPNRWTVRMSSSSMKASVHHDHLGERGFSRNSQTKSFDAPPRSIHAGVTFDVINSDASIAITELRIGLQTDGDSLIVGGTVDDVLSGREISGAVVTVDADGKGAIVSGLHQGSANGAMVWLSLSAAINDPTSFLVNATFAQ